MWLSEGDFYFPIPGGPWGLGISTIVGIVALSWLFLRRRREPASREVRKRVKTGIESATETAIIPLALEIERERRRADRAERLLDLAYQQGFVPPTGEGRGHD